MKHTLRRTFGLLLALALLFTLTPGLRLTAHADAKNIGVGVTYAVGDTVVIPADDTWILEDDSPASGKELDAGSYPVTEVTKNNPTYPQGKIQLQGEAFFGPYPVDIYVTKPEGKLADDPLGFRIKSGSGTEADPYTFEFVYDLSVTSYTVYFNSNGAGGYMNEVTGVSGAYVLPSPSGLSYPGYDFAGWTVDADPTIRQPGDVINVTASVNLYAQWTLKNLTLTVTNGTATFNGVTAATLTGLHIGDVVTVTAGPAPDGQIFDEWESYNGGTFGDTHQSVTTFTMPAGDATLWIKYRDIIETCIQDHGAATYTLYAWDGAAPLPDVAGEYFLTGDVALTETWIAPQGTTHLCLHNHNISKSGGGAAIYVPAGATLYLYGDDEMTDSVTNRITSSGDGSCAVRVNGGTLVTSVVKLYGNGAGMWVESGSASITYRTQILNNTTGILVYGGSVSMDSGFMRDCDYGVVIMDGSFSVTGGTLCGDVAAVYMEGGSFKVGYYPSINGVVCLGDGCTIGFTNRALGDTVRIPVQLQSGSGVFTSGMGNKATIDNFVSADAAYEVALSGTEAQLVGKNGLVQVGGVWCYMVNGVIDATYTGLAYREDIGWWYVENGLINFDYTGLINSPEHGWWYVTNGHLTFDATGLAYREDIGWWYVENSQITFTYNGVAEIPGYGWYYAENSHVTFAANGLVNTDAQGWWYVVNSQVDFDFVGIAEVPGVGWFYVENGQINFGANGLVNTAAQGWWYVVGGQVDFGFTGIAEVPGVGWFYVQNGNITFGANGLVNTDAQGWWYVVNSQVDFGFTGIAEIPGIGWYYVENGNLTFTANGLVNTPAQGWWYLVNSQVDFGFVGIAEVPGVGWWYVQGGRIDFGANGFVNTAAQGWWYVLGGQVRFDFTGVAEIPGVGWYYAQNGQITFNYNGQVEQDGVTWNVVNSQATPV